MSTTAPPVSDLTVAELAARVGAIPYWRIRTDPPPGTATEEDVERILREEDRICELIDGVLVEKAVSDETSILAIEIATLLSNYVKPRRSGWILGADGFSRLFGHQLRAPDVSFARRDQRPGGRPLKTGYTQEAPALAVEVFSPGNTDDEMERKRTEFFAAGTELFWIVYPERQQIEVFTSPEARRTLGREETLDGGTVLPGFSVKVGDIFDAVDLGGADEDGGMKEEE
jgi:Uma2 family endonuclease